jgi:hypothetical protein
MYRNSVLKKFGRRGYRGWSPLSGGLGGVPPDSIQWPAVELLCYTPEEFERKREQITIVREAVREGIEL